MDARGWVSVLFGESLGQDSKNVCGFMVFRSATDGDLIWFRRWFGIQIKIQFTPVIKLSRGLKLVANGGLITLVEVHGVRLLFVLMFYWFKKILRQFELYRKARKGKAFRVDANKAIYEASEGSEAFCWNAIVIILK